MSQCRVYFTVKLFLWLQVPEGKKDPVDKSKTIPPSQEDIDRFEGALAAYECVGEST